MLGKNMIENTYGLPVDGLNNKASVYCSPRDGIRTDRLSISGYHGKRTVS